MPPKLPLQKSGPRNRPDLRLFQQFSPGIYAAEGGSSDSPTSGLGFQVSNAIEKPTAQTGGRELPKPKAVKSNASHHPGGKRSSSHTFTGAGFRLGTNRDPPKSPAASSRGGHAGLLRVPGVWITGQLPSGMEAAGPACWQRLQNLLQPRGWSKACPFRHVALAGVFKQRNPPPNRDLK